MEFTIFRGRRILLQNIKSLETQLADLQERLNVIVDWINSQYYGFIGIPETVIIAMGGVVPPTKKNLKSRINVSSHLQNQEAIPKLVKTEQSTCDGLNLKNTNETKQLNQYQTQTNNPVVKLDKLSLQNIEILTSRHKVTNLHPGETASLKISCFENSSLIVCPICNKYFKLRVQMKKHALTCHSKGVITTHKGRPQRKRRATYPTVTNEEIPENVLGGDGPLFPPTSEDEIDSVSDYDKLGDSHSDASESEDTMRNLNEKIPDSATDSDLKNEIDDIDVMEDAIEHDPFISSDSTTMLQTKELLNVTETKLRKCKTTLPFYVRKSSDFVIPTTKNTPVRASRVHKIVITASEYQKLRASMKPESVTCIVCRRKYLTASQARRHEVEFHLTKEEQLKYKNRRKSGKNPMSDTPLRASKVDKIITSASELEKLVASIEPQNDFTCVVCSRKYSTTIQARRHEVEFHLSKEEQIIYRQRKKKDDTIKSMIYTTCCDECKKPFKDASALKIHKQTHLPPEVVIKVEGSVRHRYRCLKCHSLFSDKRKYVSHVIRRCKEKKIQNPKGSLQCEYCGLTCASTSALKLHMSVHSGEKKHLCNQCGIGFARYQTLRSHELALHANERKHKCQYCGKTFVFKFVKDQHEKKHLGALTVSCHICGFTFTCQQNLKQHITGVHENRRPYKCHLCDKSFKTSTARNYHVNTHNNPNGRKRGLNKDIDPLKAAAKRRHCPIINDIRVPVLNAIVAPTDENPSMEIPKIDPVD